MVLTDMKEHCRLSLKMTLLKMGATEWLLTSQCKHLPLTSVMVIRWCYVFSKCTPKPCKYFYRQFIDKNTVVPVNIINKWSNEFDIEETEWGLIFSESFSLSKNNKLSCIVTLHSSLVAYPLTCIYTSKI
jgi:hypothetical protein